MNAIRSDEMVNSQRIQQLANTIPGYVDTGQGGRGRLEQCRVDNVKVRVVVKCCSWRGAVLGMRNKNVYQISFMKTVKVTVDLHIDA